MYIVPRSGSSLVVARSEDSHIYPSGKTQILTGGRGKFDTSRVFFRVRLLRGLLSRECQQQHAFRKYMDMYSSY